jgi:hypothetical protein
MNLYYYYSTPPSLARFWWSKCCVWGMRQFVVSIHVNLYQHQLSLTFMWEPANENKVIDICWGVV